MKLKGIAAGLLAALMVYASGCSNVGEMDVRKFELVPALTEAEVIEYYKKSLAYDAIIQRNVEVHEVQYVKHTIDGADKTQLQDIVLKANDVLSKSTYDSVAGYNLVDEHTYNYIKTFLNDKMLVNPKFVSVEEALGHYFVDVEYDVVAGNIGNFTQRTNMLGIHGAFKKDYTGLDGIDVAFIRKAVADINDYYYKNDIQKSILYYVHEARIEEVDYRLGNGVSPFIYGEIVEEVEEEEEIRYAEDGSVILDDEVEAGDTGGQYLGNMGQEGESDGEYESLIETELDNDSIVTDRNPLVDVTEFNSIAGASIRQTSYMPRLDLVYNVPEEGAGVSGLGAYPSGDGGLKFFNYDRSQIKGKCTLRYVYKQNVNDNMIVYGINIYPVFLDLTSGFNATINNTVPPFLTAELEGIVERSDRAIVNGDMTALMSGKIYDDIGMAILIGQKGNHVNTTMLISVLRRVVTRDMEAGKYLIEVESTVQEGARQADVYGTYRDKYYMAIEQRGDKFIITDSMLMGRVVVKEPALNPDDAVTKQLVALNLAGPVTTVMEKNVVSLLDELYTAGSYRILNGPQTTNDGVYIERGMYDVFNDDIQILSSRHKEYINSYLRTQIVKMGVNVPAEYTGAVVEWIGGSRDQVEFITEELVTYKGTGYGHYEKAYYLVSCMDGVTWMIDERVTLEEDELVGDKLQTMAERLKTGRKAVSD